MRPDHDVRRKVIREWMSLPRDKRLTPEQASAFATGAVQANAIARNGEDPQQIVMAWLSPRIGKAESSARLYRTASQRRRRRK